MKRSRTAGAAGLIGVIGAAVTAVLVAFHGQLLWQRLADGSLLEPQVAARWLLGALLTAALASLWRRGLPLFRGRRAAVLWLVVLLLHAGGPVDAMPALVPEASLVWAAPVLLALAAALLYAARPRRRLRGAGRHPWRRREAPPLSLSGWAPALFSRPPPLPSSF